MFFMRSTSLSSSRKLLKRIIQSVKSLFTSRGTTYQRIQKNAPSFDPLSCVGACHGRLEKSISESYRELDRFYFQFTNPWGYEELDVEDNVVASSTSSKVESLLNKVKEIRDDDKNDDEKKNEVTAYEDMLEKDGIERRSLVIEKLMDMEMIESNNLENVQDIEEVLHLYSLLNCQVYIDIFDKYVMDMHSDIFNLKAT